LRDLGQEGQLSNEYDRRQNLPGTGEPELKEEE
jgi:cytochrome c oxidase subunit 2